MKKDIAVAKYSEQYVISWVSCIRITKWKESVIIDWCEYIEKYMEVRLRIVTEY